MFCHKKMIKLYKKLYDTKQIDYIFNFYLLLNMLKSLARIFISCVGQTAKGKWNVFLQLYL